MELELDDEQKLVVNYPDSTICIAGPGSGKTRTLVAKAEQLYKANEDIVCLTFTRSAAREMKERMPDIPAQTIHSFCHEWVGWKGGYPQLLEDFQNFKWKPKYGYVLVDECQDLTEEQLNIVLTITGGKIFAVGDPYQSIYGFNGSLGMEAVTRLKNKGCKITALRNNYRSNPWIVSMLNKVYSRSLVSTGQRKNGLTAVLCRTNKLVNEASIALTQMGFGHTVRYGTSELTGYKEEDYGDKTLLVMTCHSSKGLEFDYVILYKWTSWLGNEQEKNLYYVTMSRASKGYVEVENAVNLYKALERREL